jgi:hypothetical protein
MAWVMQIDVGNALFKYEDKSGNAHDQKTPLPFHYWNPGPKITDTSNIPTSAIQALPGEPYDALRIVSTGVISSRFKTILEDAEPGIHQFFPVTMKRMDGTPYPDPFYIFHPTRYAPCVLLSRSGISEKIVSRNDMAKVPQYIVHQDEIVISRPAYGERKIFGSLWLEPQALLVTDEVMARIKAANIQNIRTYPVKELDESWVFENEAPQDLLACLRERPDVKLRLTPF